MAILKGIVTKIELKNTEGDVIDITESISHVTIETDYCVKTFIAFPYCLKKLNEKHKEALSETKRVSYNNRTFSAFLL